MSATNQAGPNTLAIDVGGTGIKLIVLDPAGKPLTERARKETPRPATPDAVLAVMKELAPTEVSFDRVSVGFPGVVRAGVTENAPNLDPSWNGFGLAAALEELFQCPARVANDADVQGLAVVSGIGVEVVITLGTGIGSGLFLEGTLVPNLEMGHHPFRKGESYEEQLGKRALDDVGVRKWNRRLGKALAAWEDLFNFDKLYLGGGNAKKVEIELPPRVVIVPNVAGLLGGLALWRSSPGEPGVLHGTHLGAASGSPDSASVAR